MLEDDDIEEPMDGNCGCKKGGKELCTLCEWQQLFLVLVQSQTIENFLVRKKSADETVCADNANDDVDEWWIIFENVGI